MGITEIVKHELVDAYPVLFEKDGEIVAQFKFTAIISANATKRMTGPYPLPFVSSQYSVDQVQEIQQVLAIPLLVEKKKVETKKMDVQ